jgi:hypothetical protein
MEKPAAIRKTDSGLPVLRLGVLPATVSGMCLLAPAAPANAQSCAWLPAGGVPGVSGSVCAVATWDPDSPGPQAELLVAGGSFEFAGDTAANHVVAWNGSEWQPLGEGLYGTVYSLTVYDGDLIAGGYFTTGETAGYNVARWDGNEWQPLGSGLNRSAYALTVYNGELIAGGPFDSAGEVPCRAIARWSASHQKHRTYQ